ncbi:MAG: methionine--tRNA ligase [Patescibacteria group bacterium]
MNKFYITTPIYYVNDKPHIGSAYTTLAADVLARHYRLTGQDVFFLTGTDEHGAKVAASAAAAGQTPQEFANVTAELFALAWKNLNIKYDYFIRTTDERHETAVIKFLQKLHDRDALYKDTYRGLYCVGCERFMNDSELVDGKCPDHRTIPKKIKEDNYFFKLNDYLSKVEELVRNDEILIEPPERKLEVLGLFKQKLPEFSVSREHVEWGIRLPFDAKQHCYVWVDALINYLSAIGYGDDADDYAKWWPADLHLMAKDILKFHAIYWPALLMAVNEPMPKRLYVHGFFSIDGAKMSKSIGNVIDPNDLVTKYGVDGARYLLLTQFPFGQDGDVKAGLFTEKFNADLANGLGNLVSRTAKLIEKHDVALTVVKNIEGSELVQRVSASLGRLAFDQGLKDIWAYIADTNKYLDTEAPWKLGTDQTEKIAQVLTITAGRIREVAAALRPFLPETSLKITQQLSGPKVKKLEGLFPRLT